MIPFLASTNHPVWLDQGAMMIFQRTYGGLKRTSCGGRGGAWILAFRTSPADYPRIANGPPTSYFRGGPLQQAQRPALRLRQSHGGVASSSRATSQIRISEGDPQVARS